MYSVPMKMNAKKRRQQEADRVRAGERLQPEDAQRHQRRRDASSITRNATSSATETASSVTVLSVGPADLWPVEIA